MNAGITYLLFQKMSGDLSAPDSVFIMNHSQYMHPKFWEGILCVWLAFFLSFFIRNTKTQLLQDLSVCYGFHLSFTCCHNSMYWMEAANKTMLMAS